MKKVLCYVILVIINIFNNYSYAYENGKEFTRLPIYLAKFKNSTVGLVFVDNKAKQTQQCTGIRVAPGTIITAAHCFLGSANHTYWDISKGSVFVITAKGEYELKTSVTVQIPNDFKSRLTPVQSHSSDIAKLSFPASSLGAYSNNDYIDTDNIALSIDALNNFMFDPHVTLYALGWNMEPKEWFNYNQSLTKAGSGTNLMTTVSSTSWKYWNTLNNISPVQTLNVDDRAYKYSAVAPYWETMHNSEPSIFSNTNVINFDFRYLDSQGNKIVVEGGNSGGPVIACNSRNVCVAIAIQGAIDDDTSTDIMATFASPYGNLYTQ